MKIRVIAPNFETFVELAKNSALAKEIYNRLPIEGEANFWGGEVYIDFPFMLDGHFDKDEVDIGDFAYWPRGPSLCFFFGPTGGSFTEKPRPHSPVEVIGKMGDPLIFRQLKPLEKVRLEKA